MMPLSQLASSMARYYFSLRNGRLFDDIDGLELPDIAAVRAEAVAFARDLMRLDYDRRDWSQWIVRVTDENHNVVFDLPFAEAV
jgi:hypothetical protein